MSGVSGILTPSNGANTAGAVTPSAGVGEDPNVVACLELLESRHMSYRTRQKLGLTDLKLAVAAAEAAEALR